MARWEIGAGERVRLSRRDPSDTSGGPGSKRRALEASAVLLKRTEELQELLYATRSHAVLIVLQALDTGGKDGTIRRVFEGVNPQGVRVARFRVPTATEMAHDFLWRVHPQTPERGEIVIFNRSHYEDVLAARVGRRVPGKVWRERYRAINEFERMLTCEGTTVLKFFLQISEEEQRRRLQQRLDDPTKHWKFSEEDLVTREAWPRYTTAIEEMLERTSTRWAPWHLIPSDKKWFRDWAVSKVLVETLDGFQLRWPTLAPELRNKLIPK
jgi:PPK2 family polyphosphate:nucleotide phosphotransferase